jgi:hypothetical protein
MCGVEVTPRYAIGELVYITHLNVGNTFTANNHVTIVGVVTNVYMRSNYIDVMSQYGELMVSTLYVSTI